MRHNYYPEISMNISPVYYAHRARSNRKLRVKVRGEKKYYTTAWCGKSLEKSSFWIKEISMKGYIIVINQYTGKETTLYVGTKQKTV